MESLVIAVAIIVLLVMFVGFFVGFVIADNFKSSVIAISLSALTPAAAIVFFTTVPPLGMFWLAGYVIGYIFGVWLNSTR